MVEDPSKLFYLGQVVRCRVISTDYGKLRLSLSVSVCSILIECRLFQ
jgi:ribosomal protein S1